MNALLPDIFLGLMGFAILLYVILDGYDLGVGILLTYATDAEKDVMVASIGPFWDANETWLVLGVGLLLTAFPSAHGVILSSLYLPVAAMLVGLILRGVAFDFRSKVPVQHKHRWNQLFHLGSLITAASQGFMLGLHIVGYKYSLATFLFAGFIGIALCAGYALLGAGWLIMKCENELQKRAVLWARRSLGLTALGVLAVSLATPLVSPRIFDRWFEFPQFLMLSPIPVISLALFWIAYRNLKNLPRAQDRYCWLPFACAAGIYLCAFLGLAYSLYPFLVVDQVTIYDAAASTDALRLILLGAVITLPAILAYTVFAYRVFWGKATELAYYSEPR